MGTDMVQSQLDVLLVSWILFRPFATREVGRIWCVDRYGRYLICPWHVGWFQVWYKGHVAKELSAG